MINLVDLFGLFVVENFLVKKMIFVLVILVIIVLIELVIVVLFKVINVIKLILVLICLKVLVELYFELVLGKIGM